MSWLKHFKQMLTLSDDNIDPEDGQPIIEFYASEQDFDVIPHPVPARKMMPKWFKSIEPVIQDKRDSFNAKSFTAKKCLPLLDGMSLGFIMPLFGDVNIRTDETGRLIEAGNNAYGRVVDFHSIDQLGGRTSPTYPGPAIKFINHWVIKTKPGYSCLFIPPLNHIEPRFTCLGAVVDTDNYPKEVNFPAIWHARNYDDIVKAGTPLVTVIPFKRDEMPRDADVRIWTPEEEKRVQQIHLQQQSRRSVYTGELREER